MSSSDLNSLSPARLAQLQKRVQRHAAFIKQFAAENGVSTTEVIDWLDKSVQEELCKSPGGARKGAGREAIVWAAVTASRALTESEAQYCIDALSSNEALILAQQPLTPGEAETLGAALRREIPGRSLFDLGLLIAVELSLLPDFKKLKQEQKDRLWDIIRRKGLAEGEKRVRDSQADRLLKQAYMAMMSRKDGGDGVPSYAAYRHALLNPSKPELLERERKQADSEERGKRRQRKAVARSKASPSDH